ncbi:hypothetical protein F2Q68_00005717 [Brassica cretica]|uniref:glucan endo-1,3-beta-D-glucosidase n=1 Tax=Brassica cretica TaxID=69181 RepID=A0A8S9JNX9_BRACR|nr:hypothetical protein F2Q68_00005717 [Brassica cretica]
MLQGTVLRCDVSLVEIRLSQSLSVVSRCAGAFYPVPKSPSSPSTSSRTPPTSPLRSPSVRCGASMAVMGHENLSVIVAETGWPSSGIDSGEVDETLLYSEMFLKGLLAHLRSGGGTKMVVVEGKEEDWWSGCNALAQAYQSDECGGWTNEKHNLYLDSLENLFVEQGVQSNIILSPPPICEERKMEKKKQRSEASTWNTLKLSFLMLGLCLTFMLSIAFTSGQSMLLVHVGFLIVIASSLFVLLNWYIIQGRLTRGTSGVTDQGPSPVPLPLLCLTVTQCLLLCRFLAQTGLVPVETQMQELNLAPTDKTK